jgi:uncharacterized protein (TIGR02145 family)
MKTSNFRHGLWNIRALFIVMSLIPVLLQAQDKGTFKDSRDGQVYNWVKIGTQTWMTENLRFSLPGGSWTYENDSANAMNFGRLYTWKAAQTACPKGWHLPSDKEWNLLVKSLGGNSEAGLKIQAMDTIGKPHGMAGAASPAAVSGSLSGIRHADGSFSGLKLWGGCWIAGKATDTVGLNMVFAHGSKEVVGSTNDKLAGFSVRCMKVK